MDIKENLRDILKSIRELEKKSNREEGSVKLVAVSKFHAGEEVLKAIEEGQLLFGENRVQEAFQKFTPILSQNPKVKLHIIGSLQSNKVRDAVKVCDTIESVDRISLLKEIEKQAAKLDKNINILFELHTGEESKAGFESVEEIKEALDLLKANTYPHINPIGFMTMAPFTKDEQLIRKSFVSLREAKEHLQKLYPMFNLSELSMGMSGDYKIAIEEGSTIVRIGTAIFGERDYSK